MIGTSLIEEFVQSIALTHRVQGYSRVSAILIAAPESGKTTITKATKCDHVQSIAVMTGRSILKEVNGHENIEFLIFNDLTTIKAMSTPASNLLVTFLNQLTQDERGKVGFAGKASEDDEIKRPVGLIACMPFKTFNDKRSRWKELGFISRMIPFAYSYHTEIIAEIKDSLDNGTHRTKSLPRNSMPKIKKGSKKAGVVVTMSPLITRQVRRISDMRAQKLGEIGIRLLSNYHSLIRAHALLKGRRVVTTEDLEFLRLVDAHVSVDSCPTLSINGTIIKSEVETWQPEKRRHAQLGTLRDKRRRNKKQGIRLLSRRISTRAETRESN